MIKPLTQEEFVNIATNGIFINLYDGYVEDYINNLIKFIEETSHDFYIADYDNAWCEIAKSGLSVLKVSFETNKIIFYLKETVISPNDKKTAGVAIKLVYMHSVAWEAINNDGKINQSTQPWPI